MGRHLDPDDDIFAILAREHRAIRALFDQVDAAWETGDRARLAERFCLLAESLFAHVRGEERVVYPVLAAGDDEARAEHASMLLRLEALGEAAPEPASWRADLAALRALVEHHVAEEEEVLFARGAEDPAGLAREYLAARRELFDDADPIGIGCAEVATADLQASP